MHSGFVDHFHISLSCHLGVVKPDAACFAAALRDCDVDTSLQIEASLD
jgi:hypothetical protein